MHVRRAEVARLAAWDFRMNERPNYRPWLWGTRWPLITRWVKDRPDRVIAWYGGTLLTTAGAIAVSAIAGWMPLVIIGCVVLVFTGIEACIRVPRARRAMRDEN
jgi:hypothetical protein